MCISVYLAFSFYIEVACAFSCCDYVPVGSYRVIGPAMPSAELLAAAAKLTEAEAELRFRS